MITPRASKASDQASSPQQPVRDKVVASSWPDERLRNKEWICLSRPGQITAVVAT